MSTKVSSIFDFIVEKAQAAFPEHAELRDCEDVSNNDDTVLRKGFGILPMDGENADRCLDNRRYYMKRNFELIFTREVLATVEDVAGRRVAYKDLLEDLDLLLQQLTPNVTIPGATTADEQVAWDFKFLRDGGPRLISVSDKPYLFIEATLVVEYTQAITG